MLNQRLNSEATRARSAQLASEKYLNWRRAQDGPTLGPGTAFEEWARDVEAAEASRKLRENEYPESEYDLRDPCDL